MRWRLRPPPASPLTASQAVVASAAHGWQERTVGLRSSSQLQCASRTSPLPPCARARFARSAKPIVLCAAPSCGARYRPAHAYALGGSGDTPSVARRRSAPLVSRVRRHCPAEIRLLYVFSTECPRMLFGLWRLEGGLGPRPYDRVLARSHWPTFARHRQLYMLWTLLLGGPSAIAPCPGGLAPRPFPDIHGPRRKVQGRDVCGRLRVHVCLQVYLYWSGGCRH
ncbi:uncharacterized protein B0H18DRAFT_36434 [Fomitopsis serialis]|uniref:uncharacterized protein n=1 Tax=Fomitopsis serialis TaxID=139415 RepID=UPI0020074722|nr:uncharacterized protein B0H18DRAFT_36434 [Neoantrodia serialis]KAH9917430.1 hypothetical protein B0H18DRAFT_36434 [Neoantrodia serialis]